MKIAAWISAAAALAGLGMFCKWQNDCVTTTETTFKSSRINGKLDGQRIVHISDYHNKNFGRGQRYIVNKIRREKPDIIVITGDLVDSRRTDIETAMEFIQGILPVAPVYYVGGNHEYRLKQRGYLFKRLREAGVRILENEGVTLFKGTAGPLRLIGLADPSVISGTQGNFPPWTLARMKQTILRERREGCLNILLIHRPELIALYAQCGVDLVFCGHAHGGQIRLPLLGGLSAPNQGFFPKYTAGVHQKGETAMVISRGIGNSLAPQRLWNRPEIITMILKESGGRFDRK